MPFIRLRPEFYSMVKPLLTVAESAFAPASMSILEGTIDGQVFVNHPTLPTCASVMSKDFVGGRLIGLATDHEFNQGFVSLMTQHISSKDGSDHRLFWSTVSETWDDVIFRIFGYRVFRIDRTQFQFNRRAFERLELAEPLTTSSATVNRINPDLIARHDSLRKEIEGLWGTADNFLKHGLGWVAISSDNRIVGRCNSAFVGGGAAEVAIWADKAVRGSGIGLHLAQKFIQDCLDNNLVPNWTCDTLNTASSNLAYKLGFTSAQPYFIFTSIYFPMFHEPSRDK